MYICNIIPTKPFGEQSYAGKKMKYLVQFGVTNSSTSHSFLYLCTYIHSICMKFYIVVFALIYGICKGFLKEKHINTDSDDILLN